MATIPVPKSNPLAVLTKQFKALTAVEASLHPEVRKQHQWQLLATRGKFTYIIVKGGSNTIGYRVVVAGKEPPEWKYVLPTAMLDVLEGWQSHKYVGYKLVQGKAVIKKASVLGQLLSTKPKHTSRIVGVTPEGKSETLYEWQTGVFNADWKPIKSKSTK